MLAGIREILNISTPDDLPMYRQLLGDGDKLGLKLSYIEQPEPKGLAQAFVLGEDFIGKDSVCLVLGDNIFYGQAFSTILERAKEKAENGAAAIFGYPVNNPTSFGVVEFDKNGNAISLEEKPEKPKSNYAIPGLYFYDNSVVEIAKNVKPSARGEYEITAVNSEYLRQKRLKVTIMGRGMAWLDTGTPEGMLKASEFVQTVQSMQGFYISCIEEIAWRRGFIDDAQLKKLGDELKMTDYGKYLLGLVK